MRMRTVLIAGGMAFSLLLAACGSDGDGGDGGGGGGSAGAKIEDAGTCQELAEASFALAAEAIDDFADMSVEELIEIGESEEVPPAIQKFDDAGAAAEEKAADLDCSEEEGQQYFCDNIDQLSTEGAAGMIVDDLSAEC